MRSILLKFLLSIFIFVFAFPVSALAQNNSWFPPQGPPLGNNVPSPVNIGPQAQTKRGPLTIQGNFKGQGINIFESNPVPGIPAFSGAFTPFYFFNNVFVGSPAEEIYPTVDIQGTLRYKPPAPVTPPGSTGGQVGGQLGTQDGQTLPDGQPESGYVLTSTDNLGTVSWRPGLPTGANNGDTIIWNETCNCWTTGNGGGSGASLPSAEAGQTLWFNGVTGAWEATDYIKHDIVDTSNRTIIRNQLINLFATEQVDIGSLITGQTMIYSPSTSIIGSNAVNIGTDTLGQTNIKSPTVTFAENGPAQQNVSFRSSLVNFGIGSNFQEVSFDSNRLKIRGQTDFGQGRIPFSSDADGTFKWNENLTYNQEQIAGQNFGVLNLVNPDGGLALFRNSGYTNLLDDVVVGEEGQVFLTGLTSGYLPEREQGLIKPLCYVETTKRIVNCNTDTLTNNDNEIGDVFVPGLDPTMDGTITFTPDSPQQSFQFTHTGQVTVKYCGGGGGGGGGGIGSQGQNGNGNPVPGTGGSGGGGGGAATCFTEDINVTPGSLLTWSIGEGGNGGAGGVLRVTSSGGVVFQNTNATDGAYGESTSIFFTPVGGTESQIGQTALGGNPGTKGWSVRETGSVDINNAQLFGLSGNNGLRYGPWGWNGGRGSANDSNLYICESCGGVGGWGEAFNSNGDRLSDLDGNQPSARGGGGTSGFAGSQVNTQTDRRGKNGRCGSLSYGGGGGGGGFGDYYVDGLVEYTMIGGNGGCGGDGYVTISGLPNYNGSNDDNQFVWDVPGIYTLSQNQLLNNIPLGVATVTVEVWGAGGGSGSVPGTLGLKRHSGGGGAGMYWKRENVPVQNLIGAQFVVGAAGQNAINGNSNNMQSGSPGQASSASFTSNPPAISAIPSPNITANGGLGGQPWESGQTILGGQGGSSSTPNADGWVKTNGGNGAHGMTGNDCEDTGGAGQGAQGFGNGAPRACSNIAGTVFEGQASHGRIRISW